jgi:putative ABC transport system permease protein
VLRIALQMLFGDRTKYATLVLGLAFAALLINQQGAIFLGLLTQSTGAMQNVLQNNIWVTDPDTRYIGDWRPMSDGKLARIRSVPGVAWAEPFFTSRARAELPNGQFKTVEILGVSRSTMVGRPPEVTQGRLEDLRVPDAVMIEESSRPKLRQSITGPDGAVVTRDVQIGDVLKLNDRRAVVVGFCRAKLGWEANAMIYTTFDNATTFTPVGRERIPFVLVRTQSDDPAQVLAVQRSINALGDVAAFTRDELRWRSTNFVLWETGIGINFGITIGLGFVVGLLLSAAIFYQFTQENLRHFAVLKALGARTRTIVGMVLIQALIVGIIGYGVGLGAAALFTIASKQASSDLAVAFPWQLLIISLVGTIGCILVGSLLSLRRVVMVSPAAVFSS